MRQKIKHQCEAITLYEMRDVLQNCLYIHKLSKTTVGGRMGFDELLGIVESFCNRASQVASVTVETGSTSAGIGSLI